MLKAMPLSSSPTQAPPQIFTQESSLLSKLDSCKSIQQIKQVHAFIIKTRPTETHLAYARIISLCATNSTKHLRYARALLTHLDYPDVQSYNAIIRALSSSLQAVVLFREMLLKSLVPDSYTVPYVLKACALCRALREGEEVHGYSVKMGLVTNVYVKNTLLRLYAVCGFMGYARKLFDESPQRDLVSWTTLIQGYVKMGYPREGVVAFFEMRDGNLVADEVTLVIVLSACARLGDLSLGRKIHGYMEENKVNCDVFVGNALVDMYLKCGDAEFASEVFEKMPVKNVVSWNSMISGLAQQGKFKEALDVFGKMQRVGVKPDEFTIVGVLNSCANLGTLETGIWIHGYIDRNRIKADGFVGNALVDMYAKCGCIDESYTVFEAMKCKDVYSYTAMIVGFAMHGEAERALGIFSEMHKMGIEPDEVTFLGVLTACSHVGLVEEGWKHFEDMSRTYKLKPQIEHYSCMVDLLGRAGLISEAEAFIKNMPIEPDAIVWGALLGAIRIHGKAELGESVMQKLVEIEPDGDGAYILMSNIYSSANRWRDALKLRKAMKVKKIKKTPGCSSIELDGVVHGFRKGDKSHPQSKQIYRLLDEIRCHIKSAGCWNRSSLFS